MAVVGGVGEQASFPEPSGLLGHCILPTGNSEEPIITYQLLFSG